VGMQSQYYSQGRIGQRAEQSSMANQQPAEAFDEEAFARAFEEAAQDEQMRDGVVEARQGHAMGFSEDSASKSATEIEQGIMLEESAERFMSSESQIPNQARLGADLIHDPMTQEPRQQEDPDAMARTAGQLLDSVRTNQSSKFQKSEFLELMRQLRDREVAVKGDHIVGMNEGGAEYKVDAP